MDKSFILTRSGKAGRVSGTTTELKKKTVPKGDNFDLKGDNLIRLLCTLLLGDPDWNGSRETSGRIRSEIQTKLRTYHRSDNLRSLPGGGVPKCEEICELLIRQKCKCYYCHTQIIMLYQNVRDPLQWSVDRKDNSKSHCIDNIVISCLKCNLQRRTRDTDEFYNARNLVIQKDSSE